MGPLDVALLSILISSIDCSVNYRETKTLTRMDAGISEDAFRLSPWDNNYNLTGHSVLSPPGYKIERRNDQDEDDDEAEEENAITPRQKFFGGHRRRMHFAMLSIMYKMGVMTTLLVGLTVLVLKSLTIGVILLIFAFGNVFSKFHKVHGNQQPIHVHVHPGDVHGKVPFAGYHSAVESSGWERTGEEADQQPSSPRFQRRRYPYYGYPYYGYRPKGFRIT